ncbi:hypothetical protein [Kroppenstedtia guangzhouensis]|uniref:hypothetical protein n=1 Tax=Kroppenstedtia guangzhouensis TaxID=1274356 RepID=UPI00166CB98F|nr:hypothetical protein [Kroppenstedtia guangzhouensis]
MKRRRLPPPSGKPRVDHSPELFIDEQKGSFKTDHLRQIMWEHAGIIRDEKGLISGLDSVARLSRELEPGDVTCHNMITLSQIVLKSALLREESRGGHYRRDFPASSAAWAEKRILVRGGNSVESVATQSIGT